MGQSKVFSLGAATLMAVVVITFALNQQDMPSGQSKLPPDDPLRNGSLAKLPMAGDATPEDTGTRPDLPGQNLARDAGHLHNGFLTSVPEELLDGSTREKIAQGDFKRYRPVTVNPDVIRSAVRSPGSTDILVFQLFPELLIEAVPNSRREIDEGPGAGVARWAGSIVGYPDSYVGISVTPDETITASIAWGGKRFRIFPVNDGPIHLVVEADLNDLEID